MILKNILTALCSGALLFAVTCQDPASPDLNNNNTNTTDENPFGVFRLLIDQEAHSTSFSGALNDGETPTSPVESVMKEGELELLVKQSPFCEPCGSKAICVADDSCAPYPTKISAGTVTISGVNLANGSPSFTANTIGILKLYSASIDFADPPFSAVDTITLTAAGDEVDAFQLQALGIEPITVLSDSIVLTDGDPIDLAWTPPSVSGTTIMNVELNISYHGANIATIIGDCEDDGSLQIPAGMLTELKRYGISGFPKITLTRRSKSGVSETSRAQLVVEAVRVVYLNVPGLISCNPGNPDACPEGMTCTDDRRCVVEE
ncbi:MAG: hypothetical protein JW863_13790 [Chitinispirillaceae bacterium]|nr:hypothetical protein [Chitinispirillaceae bacterium]